MNVNLLNPGRELDEIVAKTVFDWKWDENRCPRCGWPYSKTVADGCVPGYCSLVSDTVYEENAARNRSIPHYSTIMSDAWLIVDKITGDANEKNAYLYSFMMQKAIWHGTLGYEVRLGLPYANGMWDKTAWGETGPLAICRAALKLFPLKED